MYKCVERESFELEQSKTKCYNVYNSLIRKHKYATQNTLIFNHLTFKNIYLIFITQAILKKYILLRSLQMI